MNLQWENEQIEERAKEKQHKVLKEETLTTNT